MLSLMMGNPNMQLHVYHHFDWSGCEVVFNQKLDKLIKLTEQIMATQKEHAEQLRGIGTQLGKVKNEITQKLADLEAAIANAGNTSQEVDDALAELKTGVQHLDDLHPDAPPVPPVE